MKAKKELPQPRPRVSYILLPARGNSAPRRERKMVDAAVAEAAWRVKASIRLDVTGRR